MERIKIALEKARQQAASIGGNTFSVGPAPVIGRVAPAVVEKPAAVDLIPGEPLALNETHLERSRVVSYQRTNPWSRDFDLLRTQVLQKMQEKNWQTLAITSPSMECGKTVVSINLSMSIAHRPQKRAVLVDFDLRRPRVASYLGLPQRAALNEVFERDLPVEEAIVRVGLPRFYALATHKPVSNAGEVLAADKVDRVLEALRRNYTDPIIVDLPPINAVDDTIAFLPKIDCVLLVIANGQCTRRQIEEAQRHLSRANMVGMVYNKSTTQLSKDYEYY